MEPNNSSPEKKLPYELQRLIAENARDTCASNNADYRPTYQAQLDRERAELIDLYQRGKVFTDTISAEDKQRCRRYWDATYKRNC